MLYLILYLAIFGFIVWLVVTYIPMPDVFKKVIIVVCVIIALLWVLNMLGISPGQMPSLVPPRAR